MTKKVKAQNPHNVQLMGHIIAGYPDFESSLQAALGICHAGASYLEIQFPFSDPNADGVVIEEACNMSLQAGFRSEQGFIFLEKLNIHLKTDLQTTKIPKMIIMTYANIIFAFGVEAFVKRAAECGVWGIITPDLPFGSDEGLRLYAKKYHITIISLIAPGTSAKRIQKLTKASGELVYVVARTGITGEKTRIDSGLLKWVKFVKKNCKKPIALGFGIQTNEQVEALCGLVPIIVAGSYFVQRIYELGRDSSPKELYRSALNAHAKALMGWD